VSDPRLSLLVVNYNTWSDTVGLLQSLLRHPPRSVSYEVVVVDNASPVRDPEAEAEVERLLERLPGRGQLIRHTENGGYSIGMNLALAHASKGSEWILVSNPDLVYLDDTIDALVRTMERDASIGAATPQILWTEDRSALLPPNILPTLPDLLRQIWAAVSTQGVRHYMRVRMREAIHAWRPGGDVELTMMSGCCFLVRRSFTEQHGFFDEDFPLYFEDTDFARRVHRAGQRVVQVEDSQVVHHYDRSARTDKSEAMRRYWISRERYYRKWEGWLGVWLYRLLRRIQESGFGKRVSSRSPHAHWHDLGLCEGKPVLKLPRPSDEFLVEIGLDWNFSLAAASFGSGDTWTPSDALYQHFVPRDWWFRVVDLSGSRPEEIGIWRAHIQPQPAPLPEGVA
jgi:N-acetylglucosaminyl-diphospho-decaprenol L-rhamnosyltransferase